MPRVVPGYKSVARERILEVATDLFMKKGYHGTAMDEIARKLGVSKAALYVYFKDKEELLIAASDAPHRLLYDALHSVLSEREPLVIIEHIFDMMVELTRKWNPSFSFEIISESVTSPTLRKWMKRHNEENIELICGFLEKLVEKKVLPPRTDTRSAAIALMGLFMGVQMSLISGMEPAELRKVWIRSTRALLGLPA